LLDLFAMVAESIVSGEGEELYIDVLASIVDVPGKCRQLLYDNHVHSIHQPLNGGKGQTQYYR
jgi:hypothetical protein